MSLSAEGIRRTERVAAELYTLRQQSDAGQPERSVYASRSPSRAASQQLGRGRVSALQVETARRERAERRATLERELTELKDGFQRRLAMDGTAGEVVLESPRAAGAPRTPTRHELSGGMGTPRQRIWAAERRLEKQLEAEAREEAGAVAVQRMYRGWAARRETQRRLVRRREAYQVRR